MIAWRAPGEIDQAEERALRTVFDEVAVEFVPPLTARSTTTQRSLTGTAEPQEASYFDHLRHQHNLLLFVEGELQGFLSFLPSYRDFRLPRADTCLYVSTIAVRPSARGHGYARLLYERLFALPNTLPAWVVLRTWSTNVGHIGLLSSLGFKVMLTIPDDRGRGIHTLYFGRQRLPSPSSHRRPGLR
jgi:ribosomal protein S18 acetylase RimI-like enzyme